MDHQTSRKRYPNGPNPQRVWRLVFNRAVVIPLTIAPLLAGACVLIWLHRTLACSPGWVYSLRLWETTRGGRDAPNLIENFVGGFLYVGFGSYAYFGVAWLARYLHDHPQKAPLNPTLKLTLVFGSLMTLFIARWPWVGNIGSIIPTLFFLGLIFSARPMLTWLVTHLASTAGLVGLFFWFQVNLGWKVAEMRGRQPVSALRCGLHVGQNADSAGRQLVLAVSWAHAWPQLLVSLIGMMCGVVVTFLCGAFLLRKHRTRLFGN